MNKRKISSLLILGLSLTGIKAQTYMQMIGETGTKTSFAINKISTLSFADGGIIINETNGGLQMIAISDLSKIYFEKKTTVATSSDEQMTIYPNPVNDFLQIKYQTESSQAQIEIRSIEGKLIYKKRFVIENGSASIDLSGLSKGMYICNLIIGEKTNTTKLLKN